MVGKPTAPWQKTLFAGYRDGCPIKVREKGTKWGPWVDYSTVEKVGSMVTWSCILAAFGIVTYIGMDVPGYAQSYCICPSLVTKNLNYIYIYPNKTDLTPALTTVILFLPVMFKVFQGKPALYTHQRLSSLANLRSRRCQPFTRTGKRKDVADPRCRALLRLIEVLPQLKAPPKAPWED